MIPEVLQVPEASVLTREIIGRTPPVAVTVPLNPASSLSVVNVAVAA